MYKTIEVSNEYKVGRPTALLWISQSGSPTVREGRHYDGVKVAAAEPEGSSG